MTPWTGTERHFALYSQIAAPGFIVVRRVAWLESSEVRIGWCFRVWDSICESIGRMASICNAREVIWGQTLVKGRFYACVIARNCVDFQWICPAVPSTRGNGEEWFDIRLKRLSRQLTNPESVERNHLT